MYFELLHERLVGHLRAMVRNGQLTERRLARLTGVSQPHLHNVLKGVRELSAQMADQVVTQLRLSAFDLLADSELGAAPHANARQRYVEVPLLAGRLGPGHAFPDFHRHDGLLPFLRGELAGIARPLAARLDEDPPAAGLFHSGDIALLAPLPENRPAAESAPAGGGYYAIDLGGAGLIRRVEQTANRLYLLAGDDGNETGCISLADRNILEVVRARVIWIGRYLERSPIADRPFEEAGGQDRPPGGER